MSVNLTLLTVMGALYACGIYLILERSLTRVLLGLMLLANATNLLILATGGYAGLAPLYNKDTAPQEYTDPLPQALILTSIVISFAVTAFMLGIIYRTWVLARQDEIQDDVEDLRVAETPSFDAEDDAAIPVETSEFPLTMLGGDGAPSPTTPRRRRRPDGRGPADRQDRPPRTPPLKSSPARRTSTPRPGRRCEVNIASFAPLAVVLPILGAALTFLLIRHSRAQRTVSIARAVPDPAAGVPAAGLRVGRRNRRGEHRRLAAALGHRDGGGPVLLPHAGGVLRGQPRRAGLRHRAGHGRRRPGRAGVDLPPHVPDPGGRACPTRSCPGTCSTCTWASRSC